MRIFFSAVSFANVTLLPMPITSSTPEHSSHALPFIPCIENFCSKELIGLNADHQHVAIFTELFFESDVSAYLGLVAGITLWIAVGHGAQSVHDRAWKP